MIWDKLLETAAAFLSSSTDDSFSKIGSNFRSPFRAWAMDSIRAASATYGHLFRVVIIPPIRVLFETQFANPAMMVLCSHPHSRFFPHLADLPTLRR